MKTVRAILLVVGVCLCAQSGLAQPRPEIDSSLTRATFRFHDENPSPRRRVRAAEVSVENNQTISIDLWQGECRFALNLENGQELRSDGLHVTGDTISMTSGRLTHRLYALADDALEWMISLDRAPDTNCLNFPVQTSGLRLYYQPPLSDSEVALGCYRPDSVVGSWAAYHSSRSGRRTITNRSGDTARVEDYGCGKAFHVYRPRAWDSSGDTVWCDLLLDYEHLILTVPQDFLQRATYPVTVDPEIGFTGVGASYRAVLDYGQANADPGYTYVATSGDYVTGYYAHTKVYSGTKTCEAAVYSMPGDSLNGGSRLDTAVFISVSTTDYAWNSVAGLNQALVAGTRYAMAIGNTSGTINISYDASVVPDNVSYAADNQSLMSTWVQTGKADHRLSMYALVENSSGSEVTPSRRRSLLTGEK